ncbi:serine hydrolase [Robiginitalea marina]|uniref:Class A beta-lactamase-related serine hydrolase n=1 Tax=Robiginitalea marina TaxID=2954105 RepID=A0ABT1AV76_9FLAO|nr:serine hydrolase [Robiginitalea marina]MCO5723963.1 class A beta-lactamase-related serine hydrolase [Robiginitalea marina]
MIASPPVSIRLALTGPKRARTLWAAGALLLLSLGSCQKANPPEDPLAGILASENPAIARVMKDPGAYEVQVVYSRIRRESDSVRFTDYTFRADPNQYFYPASTAKFPVALAALEKLNEIDSLDRNTRYYIEGDSVEKTFARDIIEIFAVSDNHANNRLFEFLGQDDINRRIAGKGAGKAAIRHRLGFHRDDLFTQPLVFYLNDSLTTPSPPIGNSPPKPLEIKGVLKGRGWMDRDSLIPEPFDFSLKNYIPVTTLHGLMKRVIFPGNFPREQRFHLSREQYDFLLGSMKLIPREAGYDPELYPDGYCKFFLYGDTEDPIPEHIEIYNKVGFAYGTLTDCAYIKDTRSGVEFILTATILVNENGIFNDDQYEYDEIGLPFLAALGREVYAFELENKD